MSSTKLRNACGTSVAALILNAVAAHASVEISAAPTSNMNCSAGVCSPTAKKAVLNVTDLANMLASGDVTVQSTSLAPDIDINAALSWTSASRLTVDSYHSIAFNKPLVVAGSGALTITTDDGSSGGDFRFPGKGHVKFWSENSSLVINGHRYVLLKNISNRISHVGCFVALARSVDLHGKVFTSAPVHALDATFEGLGNHISHLTIHDSGPTDPIGLFGAWGGTGCPLTIRDLQLQSVDIQGDGDDQSIGALVPEVPLGAAVVNVSATGTISANGDRTIVGGLVATVTYGSILNSNASMTISGNIQVAGGLVGKFAGTCDSTCFRRFGLVDQSYSTGSVTISDDSTLGGLVGANNGGTVSNSYAAGNLVAGASANVGGLVGAQSQANTDSNPVVQSSYSLSPLSAGSGSLVGGLIGTDIEGSGLSNNYWDTDTSGIQNPHQGAGNVRDDPGITGLTDAQLKSGLPAGFDPAIWAQKSNINNGYPYLRANPPQ